MKALCVEVIGDIYDGAEVVLTAPIQTFFSGQPRELLPEGTRGVFVARNDVDIQEVAPVRIGTSIILVPWAQLEWVQ